MRRFAERASSYRRLAVSDAKEFVGVDTYEPTFCCQGECCAPGSWCCAHAGTHDHDEPKAPE